MPAVGNAVRSDAGPEPVHPASPGGEAGRAMLYGGLVGDLLGEIEQRLVVPPFEDADGPDVFHRLSVAAGYLGLAAGCAATALGIAALV